MSEVTKKYISKVCGECNEHSENKILKENIANLMRENADDRAHFEDEVNRMRAAFETRIAVLTCFNNTLEEYIKNERLKNMQAEIQENKTITVLRSENERMTIEIYDSKKRLADTLEENERLNTEIDDLMRRFQKLKASISEMQSYAKPLAETWDNDTDEVYNDMGEVKNER